jgi:hypothetical protein
MHTSRIGDLPLPLPPSPFLSLSLSLSLPFLYLIFPALTIDNILRACRKSDVRPACIRQTLLRLKPNQTTRFKVQGEWADGGWWGGGGREGLQEGG